MARGKLNTLNTADREIRSMFDEFKIMVEMEYENDNSFGKPGVLRKLISEPDLISIEFDDGTTVAVPRCTPEKSVHEYVTLLVDQLIPIELREVS